MNSMPCVREHVHQRRPEPLGVSHNVRRTRIKIQGDVIGWGTRPRGRCRCAADLVQVGLCKLEADRAREVEDVGHDAIQALRFLVDVGHGVPKLCGRDAASPQRRE